MSISPKRTREIEAIRDVDIDYSDIPEAGLHTEDSVVVTRQIDMT